MSWVIIHSTKIRVYVKLCLFSRKKGEKGRKSLSHNGPKQEVSAFSCHLLLDLCRFLRIGVSRDAKRNDEVWKCHFLLCLPNRKCLHFPVSNWLICAIYSWRGVSQGAEHYGEVGNVVASCFASLTGSASIFLSLIDWFVRFSQEREVSRDEKHNGEGWNVETVQINHYRQKNAGTSFLASKTGSHDIFDFTIVFRIPRIGLPEKSAGINQLPAGKCWHFLFGKQNRKWSSFKLHHCT